MPAQKHRTCLPILRHKMSFEQRTGFKIALKYRARYTAACIRSNKYSLGQAVVSACHEIGTQSVISALVEVRNPEWCLCAIRYAPHITQSQREQLRPCLTGLEYEHVTWVLQNVRHLSGEERTVLKWLSA